MKLVACSISIAILVCAHSVLSQRGKPPTEEQMGDAWQKYQQASQAVEDGTTEEAERLFLEANENCEEKRQ